MTENEVGFSNHCRIGVDIGGTFTDVTILWDDGRFATKKVLSTPGDYSKGITDGISPLLDEFGISPDNIKQIIHATTVATNAILSRKGARTALITTRGFRDVLELRRIRIPRLYDLFFEKPAPLVLRRYRLEVDERVDARGKVLTPLDMDQLNAAIQKVKDDRIESVAVCFLNSFLHPDHEKKVGEVFQSAMPEIFLSLSVDVLPEIREYERTSTTVINAYIGPIVKHYLRSLLARLSSAGIRSPVLLMQSNGGIMGVKAAMEKPAHLVESGPAAGVVAATRLAEVTGYRNLISFDMGGTTAKAAMVEDAGMAWTTEAEVGGGITLSSRLVKGGGYALKLPMIDLSEVGAGGGSIARLDKFGSLNIGPDSAGADPGPACYDRGGEEPTLTDGDAVLGFVNPDYLAGGAVRLNSKKAFDAIDKKIAKPLGRSVHEAAYGMYTIANAEMIRAIKAVSTYRGRDPREFSLLAFGGSGPIHAVAIARELNMQRVIVPRAPGLFSAIGLLVADVEYHAVRTFLRSSSQVNPEEMNEFFTEMIGDGIAELVEAGYGDQSYDTHQSADMRYKGQAFELNVSLPKGRLSGADVAKFPELFGTEHLRTYGHRAVNEEVELMNLRIVVRKSLGKPRIFNQDAIHLTGRGIGQNEKNNRKVYFGPHEGFHDTRVLARRDLQSGHTPGPLIVEEYDATVVVPPGCSAELDRTGNILVELEARA